MYIVQRKIMFIFQHFLIECIINELIPTHEVYKQAHEKVSSFSWNTQQNRDLEKQKETTSHGHLLAYQQLQLHNRTLKISYSTYSFQMAPAFS